MHIFVIFCVQELYIKALTVKIEIIELKLDSRVSKEENPVCVGHTVNKHWVAVGLRSGYQKSNRLQIETILCIVLKFQFDHACFERGEASTTFSELITT